MSFRIEDILKIGPKKQIEHKPIENLLERDREKGNILSKLNCFQPHYLPYVGAESLEFQREAFEPDYAQFQPAVSCCSRVGTQTNDRIAYTSPYLYAEKIYSSVGYNHTLPFNFPIYNHYSKRRNQVRFSTSQTKALEHKFSWQKYLSPEDRKLLAYSLKLSDRQVKTWFQNRRAKWRRNIGGTANTEPKSTDQNQTQQ